MAGEQKQRLTGHAGIGVELLDDIRHRDREVGVDAPTDELAELVERDEPARHFGFDSTFVTSDDGAPAVRHPYDVATTRALVVHELVTENSAAGPAVEASVDRDQPAAAADVLDTAAAGLEVRPLKLEMVTTAQVTPRVPTTAAHRQGPYEAGVTAMSSTLNDQEERRWAS